EFGTRDRPRFVIGSVGPGTKQPSIISNAEIAIDPDALYESHKPQMLGLLEGGVDAILIETCFDILQSKTAVICALDAMREVGVQVPLIGINCALGPKEMVGHVQQLSRQCTRKISCLPNAGLPDRQRRGGFPA